MYSTYPYSSSYYGGSSLAGLGTSFVILAVIAFIAAIVCTVIMYKKYVGATDDPLVRFGDKQTWGPFLRFERLAIDRILKALYLFLTLLTAFDYVAVVISSIFSNSIAGFFFALLVGFVVLVICEVLLRLGFEATMLLVIVTNNTNMIRTSLAGGAPSFISPLVTQPAPVAPSSPTTPPVAPTAPEATVAHEVAPSAEPASEAGETGAAPTTVMEPTCEPTYVNPDGSWTCPTCGSTLNRGNFCKQCGTPRPAR